MFIFQLAAITFFLMALELLNCRNICDRDGLQGLVLNSTQMAHGKKQVSQGERASRPFGL
jgi:hypothetical protein